MAVFIIRRPPARGDHKGPGEDPIRMEEGGFLQGAPNSPHTYVCVYVGMCMYIYIYICMYMCSYVCIYIYIHVCVCIYIYIYIFI